LEERFANAEFLDENEIESLADFARSSFKSAALESTEVSSNPRRQKGSRARLLKINHHISSGTRYIRLTYMAEYLGWLALRLVLRDQRKVSAENRELARQMTTKLLLGRPNKSSKSGLTAKRGLTKKAQERLLDIIRLDSPLNPFQPAARRRNQVVVQLFFHLGERAGELLALKTTDFDFESNEVVFARRHGDPTDPRKNQPVLKTLDRRLPFSNSLATAVFSYINEDRRAFRAAKKHLFLIVTHQKGPYQGMPLSVSGLAKIFNAIRDVDPVLLAELTPHILRHTSNDNLSEMWDTYEKPPTPAEEEKMRSYSYGWRQGSGTAGVYTRRHTEKKAHEASLKLQKGWEKRKPDAE
jgi:integrase